MRYIKKFIHSKCSSGTIAPQHQGMNSEQLILILPLNSRHRCITADKTLSLPSTLCKHIALLLNVVPCCGVDPSLVLTLYQSCSASDHLACLYRVNRNAPPPHLVAALPLNTPNSSTMRLLPCWELRQ